MLINASLANNFHLFVEQQIYSVNNLPSTLTIWAEASLWCILGESQYVKYHYAECHGTTLAGCALKYYKRAKIDKVNL